jgi:hypothetical protein
MSNSCCEFYRVYYPKQYEVQQDPRNLHTYILQASKAFEIICIKQTARLILGPKRDEVTGEWRKMHNEELHILYSSPNIIRQIKSRRMRWAGHVACMGEKRNVYKVLMGKPEGKRPLGRLSRRWEDGIRVDLREIGWGGGVERIQLAQDRDQWRALVNTVMNLQVLAPRS